MAKLIAGEDEREIPDGSQIKDAAEELNVIFGCKQGICGTCKIEVLKGEENLDELNEQEIAMGDRDRTHRLACQCSIKKGEVRIRHESWK